MRELSDYSLKDRETMESPYDFYRLLREDAPVHRDPRTGFYIVSRYNDIVDLLRDPETYSSEIDRLAVHSTGADEEVIAIYMGKGWTPLSTLDADPPEHTKFRSLLNDRFTPHAVKAMQPAMESLATRLLESFPEGGECEFVESFAHPFPLTVMIDLLGVPHEDQPLFRRWTDAAIDVYGMMISREREIECAEQGVELQHYLAEQFRARETRPRDDLLTYLNQARYDGVRPLTVEEKLAIAALLLVAGNHTTSNGLSNAMFILVDQPGLFQRLKANPEKVTNFVEEALRYESPVQGEIRIVKRDTHLAGVFMPQGAIVNFRVAAANRDAARFERPDRFDLDRGNSGTHLAFGAGIHRCLGAQLARMEMNVALRAIVGRFGGASFPPRRNDFIHSPSAFLRGFEALHVRLQQETASP